MRGFYHAPVPASSTSTLYCGAAGKKHVTLVADEATAPPIKNLQFPYALGKYYLYAPVGGKVLFTDNETNAPRVFGCWAANCRPHVKDAFHRYIVTREQCVGHEIGTKSCIDYSYHVAAGESVVLRLRLSSRLHSNPLADVDEVVHVRHQEADEFYESVHPPNATPDERLIQRQALAGMPWSKQIYIFDVHRWMD